MNNKRGFTLVELLAVLAMLGAISLIVVSGISASLERQDIKDCESQKTLAINAAKIYFSLNSNKDSVTVSELITGNYLESNKIGKLKGSDKVTIGSSNYSYTGTVCE